MLVGILIACGFLQGSGNAAPVSISLPATVLQENTAARSLVGNFTVTDPTQASGHEFDLVAGQGDTHNALFFTDGRRLRIRSPLDYEKVGGELDVRVRATDSAAAFVEQTFRLTLSDARNEDIDRDGLSEATEEDQHRTSDLDPDTDHDGVGDAAEVQDGTSPTDPLVYSAYPLVAWGSNESGTVAAPYARSYLAVSAGGLHAAASRFDGAVTTWGGVPLIGQTPVPGAMGPVAKMSAGGANWWAYSVHTMALFENGLVRAWGSDHSGQSTVPAGLGEAVDISAGRGHCLALKRNGEVVAWGNNQKGQSTVPPNLGSVVSVKAGGHFSLALKDDGTVTAWGQFFDGEKWLPMRVPEGLSHVVEISAGWFHALALLEDGSVVGWGSNSLGQISLPPAAAGVVGIAAGGFHSLAVNSDGKVLAWGANQHGQASVPAAALQNVASVAAGGFYSLAMRQSGELPRFTSPARLVTSPGSSVSHPVLVGNATALGFEASGLPSGLLLNPLTGLITGSLETPLRALARLRVTTDKGRIEQSLWISAEQGLAPTQIYLDPPLVVENSPGNMLVGVLTAEDLDLEDTHQFELVDGVGSQRNHQFRIDNGMLRTAPGFHLDFEATTLPLTVRVRATDASLNVHETVVTLNFMDDRSEDNDGDGLTEADEEDIHLTSDLLVDSDRDGYSDALEVRLATNAGNSTQTPSGSVLVAWGASPNASQNVPTDLGDIVAIASGNAHHLALRANGSIVAWGENSEGQASAPGEPMAFLGIAAGGFHSLGLRADGTVIGWGRNTEGQAQAPVGLVDVVQVAAGKSHSLALKSDGGVVAWGRNTEGQSTVPSGLATAVAVAAGDDFSVALLHDGTLVSWGTGAAGTGGIASAGGSLVLDVAAGSKHGLALRADGTVFGWGWNGSGQIAIPSGLAGVVAIAAGENHSVALKNDGTVVVWGIPPGATPYDARDLDFISSGGSQILALRREVDPPRVVFEPPLEASPTMAVNYRIQASGGTPLSFAVLGLQEDLNLNPASGLISGTVATGQLRSVRITIKTNTGATSRVVAVNTRDGVTPDLLTFDSIPVIETAPPATYVGTLAVVDRDPLDAHIYELVQGTGSDHNTHFAISGNQLVVSPASTLDFETMGANLSIRVKVTDLSGKSIDRRFMLRHVNNWTEDEDSDGLNESEEAYQTWAVARNLPGEDALPNGNVSGGVENLVRYAFPVDKSDSDTIASIATVYEAELAELSGVVPQDKFAGFTGTGYGDYTNNSNDFIQWNLVVPLSQSYSVGFRYAVGAGPTTGRPLELSVNGVVIVPSQPFPRTGPSWENWNTVWINLPLVAGPNQVKLRAIGSSGGNFDHLQLQLTPQLTELTGRQGTPAVSLRREANGDLVQIRYIRRRGAGLIYSILHSTELETSAMREFGGVPIVIGLDDNWELVTVEQLLPASLKRFVCLGVEFP